MSDTLKLEVLDHEAARRAYTLVPELWRSANELEGIIRQAPDVLDPIANMGPLVRMRDALWGFCIQIAESIDNPVPKVGDTAEEVEKVVDSAAATA